MSKTQLPVRTRTVIVIINPTAVSNDRMGVVFDTLSAVAVGEVTHVGHTLTANVATCHLDSVSSTLGLVASSDDLRLFVGNERGIV